MPQIAITNASMEEVGDGTLAARIADAIDEPRIDCPEQVFVGGLKSEQFEETDKEVIRKMVVRIDRYAERQGAYWEN